MSFDPQRVQALKERRNKMSREDREIEALESIADNLGAIHLEVMNIARLLTAQARTSSFKP